MHPLATAAGALNAEANFRQDAAHLLTATAKAPMLVRWDPAWSARPNGDADLALRSSGLSLVALNAFTGRNVREISGELAADVHREGTARPFEAAGNARAPPGGVRRSDVRHGVRERARSWFAFDAREARLERLSARGGDGTLGAFGVVPLAANELRADPARIRREALSRRLESSLPRRRRGPRGDRRHSFGTGGARPCRGARCGAAAGHRFSHQATEASRRDDPHRLVRRAGARAERRARTEAAESLRPCDDRRGRRDPAEQLDPPRRGGRRSRRRSARDEGTGSSALARRRGPTRCADGRFCRDVASTVSRGSIAFTGGPEIDPPLDVVADYKATDTPWHAIVSGTANAPALTLASDPSLEQADIVSVLLFGKPAKDLNDGQKTDLKAKAAEIAGSYAFNRDRPIRDPRAGAREQGIQSRGLSPERSRSAPNLTDKTYVTLGQNIGDKKARSSPCSTSSSRTGASRLRRAPWAAAASTSSGIGATRGAWTSRSPQTFVRT